MRNKFTEMEDERTDRKNDPSAQEPSMTEDVSPQPTTNVLLIILLGFMLLVPQALSTTTRTTTNVVQWPVTKVGTQNPGAAELLNNKWMVRPWDVWIHHPIGGQKGRVYFDWMDENTAMRNKFKEKEEERTDRENDPRTQNPSMTRDVSPPSTTNAMLIILLVFYPFAHPAITLSARTTVNVAQWPVTKVGTGNPGAAELLNVDWMTRPWDVWIPRTPGHHKGQVYYDRKDNKVPNAFGGPPWECGNTTHDNGNTTKPRVRYGDGRSTIHNLVVSQRSNSTPTSSKKEDTQRMAPRSSGYASPVQWMVTKGDIGSDFAKETDTNDTATEPLYGISRWTWEKWKKPEVIITPDKAGSSRNVPWTGTHDAPGQGLRIEVDIRNYPEATLAGRRPNGKETRRKSRKPRSWPTAALRNDQNAPGDESGGPRSSSRPRVRVRLFSSDVSKVPGGARWNDDEHLGLRSNPRGSLPIDREDTAGESTWELLQLLT